MTLAPEAPFTQLEQTAPLKRWELSDQARGQLEGAGIALSELFRLLQRPSLCLPQPATPGDPCSAPRTRMNGWGLTAVVQGESVISVGIDGASSGNWSDWAVERAAFGDGDVAGADAFLAETMRTATRSLRTQRRTTAQEKARARRERRLAAQSPVFPVQTRTIAPTPTQPAQPPQRAQPVAVDRPTAPAPVVTPIQPVAAPSVPVPREPVRTCDSVDVLSLIHPALRAAVMRSCGRDLSKVRVISPTKIDILY